MELQAHDTLFNYLSRWYKAFKGGWAINCYLWGGFGCQKGAVLNVWGSGSIFQVAPPLSEPVHMWCQGPNEVTGSDSSVPMFLKGEALDTCGLQKGFLSKDSRDVLALFPCRIQPPAGKKLG
ncbi:hypothetical protein CDAR_25481 [Caerostris darwini]|uniref:Uncharacterized protein n=1 Tax=Caerostris darwini TaxID=1538125 RepID=A0AAV4TZE8_9ARAC|nr:hypothetical protein CDAR_25481 [Caerostris darwini]